jgi:phosphotransferase system IIB component
VTSTHEEQPADALAARLLTLVGGPRNIAELTHCWGRLRFVLRDDAAADEPGIESLPQVAIVVRQRGQLQVALRSGLLETYDALRTGLTI